MCGIAGWFTPGPTPRPEERLGAMLAAIAHRGPDGRGLACFPQAALGHARLAIIDLEGGAQPMRALGRDLTIAFNGEIYNYRELRRGLEAHGLAFATGSDTEVILNLYQAEGVAGLPRLRGMYAFALWDGDRGAGVLVRDPLGIKPCFVHQTPDGGLWFGSEAKALLAAHPGLAELDTAALHLLLNFRYLPGDLSLFRGIRQLPPGAVWTWSPTGLRRATLAPPPPLDPDRPLLEALRDSVQAHLEADVEVGAYLSGGIDSATVAALGRGPRGIGRTFTLAVGDDPREAQYAARSAELLGVANLCEPPLADPARVLPRLVWHLETPKVNALQVYQLAGFAARHVKVALSGLGGDELFLGYNAHRLLHLYGGIDQALPRWATRPVGRALASALGRVSPLAWSEPERAGLMLAATGHWDRVYGLLRNLWDSPGMRRRVYGERMLDADLPDAFAVLAGRWQGGADPVAAMAATEWREKMVNDLLWQEDRVSMAHGLEVRVPFVDAVLAQRVQTLSRAELMPRGRPKGLMRALVADLLPREILDRPKSGFQVDAPSFVADHLGGLLDAWLEGPGRNDRGLFNPAFVRAVRAAGTGWNPRWHWFLLYLILGTWLWEVAFIEGPGTAPPAPRG